MMVSISPAFRESLASERVCSNLDGTLNIKLCLGDTIHVW